MGKLFICATPLGNLQDISFRLLETLKFVPIILCEDTRVSQKILTKYLIKNKKLITYHRHNKNKLHFKIISWLKQNKNIALVSDAGMPGIADEERDLINLCYKEKITVEIIPGASAFLLALIYSGFNIDRFSFYSFIPKKEKDKLLFLSELNEKSETQVFYESPHGVLSTLNLCSLILKERKICVARELTKIYEEIIIDEAQKVYNYFLAKEIKGEFVIIISANEKKISTKIKNEDETFIKNSLLNLIKMGYTKKDAVKFLNAKTNYKKNLIYKILTKIF